MNNYKKHNIFYIYEFSDNKGEYIIVQKLTNDTNDNKYVSVISKTNYTRIGEIYGFQKNFVKKEIKNAKNLNDVKKYYPQYFI